MELAPETARQGGFLWGSLNYARQITEVSEAAHKMDHPARSETETGECHVDVGVRR